MYPFCLYHRIVNTLVNNGNVFYFLVCRQRAEMQSNIDPIQLDGNGVQIELNEIH